MPDEISPRDRHLIESYPDREIKRFPMGASMQEKYTWNGHKLVGGDNWAAQIKAGFEGGKRRKGHLASIEARIIAARMRRDKIRAVYKGQTHVELSKMFECSTDTISKDLNTLRKEGWIK